MRPIEQVRKTIKELAPAEQHGAAIAQIIRDAADACGVVERLGAEVERIAEANRRLADAANIERTNAEKARAEEREKQHAAVLRVPCFLVGLAAGRNDVRLLTEAECSEIHIPVDGIEELNRIGALGLLGKPVVLVIENPATGGKVEQ